jgi:HK97 family phage prohead protease
MNRAYSTFEIKSFDEGEGILRGIASTPATDRVGDIVEAKGAKFALPIPLLWQHDSKSPIGTVTEAKVTPKGIEVVAKVARGVSEDIDKAWRLIRAGLVRGFSIGFRGLDVEQIPNSYGVRFKSWEWLELSAVTIPANHEATILSVKQFDSPAAHERGIAVVVPVSPQASTSADSTPKPSKGKQMNESLRAMEAGRDQKKAQLSTILQKSQDEGRTLDVEEQKRFDEVRDEITAIDAHIKRLREFEALSADQSTPAPSVDKSFVSVGNGGTITHQRVNQEKGIAFARYVRSLFMAKGNHFAAAEIAKELYKDDPRIAMHLKATVVAGSTLSGTWAADLLTTDGGPFAEFLEYLRPQTLIGRIPGLRRVQFYAPVGVQTGGGIGYWVGEGKGKPLTALDFDKTSLAPLTAVSMIAVTKQLLKYNGANADQRLRDELAKIVGGLQDTDFIDPAKTASAGVSPASITNGLSAPNSAGNTADDVREDIKTILTALTKPLTGLVFVTDTSTALALSLMVNSLGQREFPGVAITGGELMPGVPLIVSDYVPAVTAGSLLIGLKAPEILVADEGGFQIDMSEDATLEMTDTPLGSSVATVAASATLPVSMFQTNSVAFRCERDMNWARARAGSVALVDQVNYGEGA